MKSSQTLIGSGLALVALGLGLGLLCPQVSSQPAVWASPNYQLLANPGLEVFAPAYAQYEGVDCQVAEGWDRFWYDGPEPHWMDSRVFASSHLGTGNVERIEEDTSQLIISTEPYTAGIQQQVAGLAPGAGYGFHAAMLTIFQTSAPPAVHGTMIKQVGMDPTGGTDPAAPTVVWSEPDDHDEGPWDITRIVASYAQAPTMTVFIRVISPLPSGGLPFLNYSILDSSILARTATVAAVSPAVSDEPTFTVDWDNAVASCTDPNPDLCKVKWYDVQWLDEAEGVWHEWVTFSEQVRASFTGERGHTYHFRARAWQSYPNGAHLFGPYRPEGDTQTLVAWPELTGQVWGNNGQPVTGAVVAISGTAHTATSEAEGRYGLKLPPLPGPQTITIDHPVYLAPAPVQGVTFGPNETVVLTWTVRPPDDAVANGGFEDGLEGWTPGLLPGPELVEAPVHTGLQAVALGGRLTQTVALVNSWEPVLSFWYRPAGAPDPGDRFNVVLTVVTQTLGSALPVTTTHRFSPSLDADTWQHTWYEAGLPGAGLTGTLTLHFAVWNDGDEPVTTVYLDEVSLGSTPGGPYRAYIPLVFRGP